MLGTKKPAEDGTLTALLSGVPDDREAVRPVAQAVAAKVVDVGDRVGDASRLKLILNTWVFLVTESTAEVLALAEASGIDARRVLTFRPSPRLIAALNPAPPP